RSFPPLSPCRPPTPPQITIRALCPWPSPPRTTTLVITTAAMTPTRFLLPSTLQSTAAPAPALAVLLTAILVTPHQPTAVARRATTTAPPRPTALISTTTCRIASPSPSIPFPSTSPWPHRRKRELLLLRYSQNR